MTKKELIQKMRSEGLSYREIERQTGISRSLISYHCSPEVRQNALQQQSFSRQVIRGRIRDYKVQRGCKNCGESHPACLDLHHKDPSQKDFTVADFKSYTLGWDKIVLELEKCDVLCANCHRKEHAKYDETL